MVLDKSQLKDLTGTARRDLQISWLRQNRIPFLIGHDGRPKVLLNTINFLLGVALDNIEKRRPRLNLK